MSDEDRGLAFPREPGYYSVIQTSSYARFVVLALYAAAMSAGTWGFLDTYLNRRASLGLYGLPAYAALLIIGTALIVITLYPRPFLVKDGAIQLMRSVRLKSGGRTRRILFSDIADASLKTTPKGKLQIWVELIDGTRCWMVTLSDEEGKGFARRFAHHFSRDGG